MTNTVTPVTPVPAPVTYGITETLKIVSVLSAVVSVIAQGIAAFKNGVGLLGKIKALGLLAQLVEPLINLSTTNFANLLLEVRDYTDIERTQVLNAFDAGLTGVDAATSEVLIDSFDAILEGDDFLEHIVKLFKR